MYNIVIVDDEVIMQNAIRKYIETNCFDFNIAGVFNDGQEALNYINTSSVDIVITDIKMPNVDGLELVQQVRQNGLDCIFIIISAYDDFQYAKVAIECNVFGYLLKPLDFDELHEQLLRAKEKLNHEREHIMSTEEEDNEIFFIDLMFRKIMSVEQLYERFNKLSLPGFVKKNPGSIICISISKEQTADEWPCEKERLDIAFKNIIKFLYHDSYICLILKKGLYFYYIIVSNENIHEFNENILKNNINESLGIETDIEEVSRFSEISEFIDDKQTIISDVKSYDDDPVQRNIALKKALEYIDQNYQNDIARDDVAEVAHLSSAYFSRYFKQKIGMSFFDYLTNVRMKKAIELLETDMRVNEIAEMVGYQNRNRFFINFKRYTSYNPTEYRIKILKMER